MSEQKRAWLLDQLAKSTFFHHKLHEWQLLETAQALEEVHGETLDWNLENLNISQIAWNKIIHEGIKPVRVFAHPEILLTVSRSTSYYRMLAMVSQKSMKRVGLDVDSYEQQDRVPGKAKALQIAQILNNIISNLIETDEEIDPREFDLWRGMAAGTQAQGSWQNTKGDKTEILIKGLIYHRLEEKEWLSQETVIDVDSRFSQIKLIDGRTLVFGDEPDIAVYSEQNILVAVEVKGGIDQAGVLERVGAAIKSLSRAKQENVDADTILILQSVSMSEQAQRDLAANHIAVNYWFTIEDILDDVEKRETFLSCSKFNPSRYSDLSCCIKRQTANLTLTLFSSCTAK